MGTYSFHVNLEVVMSPAYILPIMTAMRCLVGNRGEKFAWKPLPEAIQKSRTPAPVETALGRDRTPVERFFDAVAP